MDRCIKFLIVFAITFCLLGCSRTTAYQGYVEGVYSYLASAIAGNLTQIFVNRGDRVVAGQPIFVLDPEPESHKLQQAKSNLAEVQQQLLDLQKGGRETIINALIAQRLQAAANYDLSQKTLKRYESLLVNNAIDKETVDEARATNELNQQRLKELEANLAEAKLGAREHAINAQQAAVNAADAAVKEAEWALLQKSVRAPMPGQIIETLYQVGEFVIAGSPVAMLLPPQKIKVVFFVPEKVISRIKINEYISFSCDGCNKNYQAKINFISPRAEFTPPVIFSRDSRDKLVFRVEAYPTLADAILLNPGQPVDVVIKQ